MASSVKYVKTYVDVLVKMRTDGTFIPVKVLDKETMLAKYPDLGKIL